MENFVQRFAFVVGNTPEKTALVCGDDRLTYRRLDELSSKIAARLMRNGAEKEKIYPIVLERSNMYIAAIIGVLKSGAAYSPLSVGYPKDRVDYIKKDSGADLIIDNTFLDGINDEPVPNALPEISMQDAAVAIYTSGSTGNPKGIIHDHFSFTSTIVRQLKIGCGADDVQMSVTPFSFAISSCDILTSLWAGAQIHILTDEQRKDISFIDEYIDSHGITSSVISPQLLKRLPVRKSTLRLINSGGERISGAYSPYTAIKNAYGLSELLSIALSFELDRAYDNTPIGKPLDGYKAYLLDKNGEQVADGEEGELCISGTMARGYINLPELTAKVFTDNPFSTDDTDKRLLHTGDIAKKDENGNIVYVNRKDWMVKVNGQRVEMGEVEVILSRIEGVTNAVVKSFTDDNGQTYICGYYTAPQKLSDKQIRAELAKSLPSYMIPRFIVKVDEFPLTPNGKLDRKALQAPKAEDFAIEYRAAQTEEEKLVCKAFEDLLGLERVGVDDDFFALGGDSIKSVMLQEQLSGYSVSAKQIFEKRTPCEIAKCLSKEEKIKFVFEHKDAYPMTDPQLGIYLANIHDTSGLEYNNPASMFFEKDMGIDAHKLADAVKQTAELYPFMKVCARIIGTVACIVPVSDMQIDVPVIQTQQTDIDELCREFVKPFDLENGPLFRFAVYETPDGVVYFSDIHHLITDGTSESLFVKNLARIYNGKAPEKELVNSFMVSTYEQKLKQSSRFDECKKFFDDMLSGIEVDSNIIPDEIEAAPEKNGGIIRYDFAEYADASQIGEFCKKLGITENTLFLGAFSYALAKQSGQELALLCAVENGRHLPELKNTFGMLVHTLPLCIKTDDDEDVSSYLSRVQNTLFESLDHDLVSIVQLAGEYDVNSDILFVYQGEMFAGVDFGGKTITRRMHKTGDAMAKLSLDVFKLGGNYTLSFEYRKDLYLEQTIDNFARMYINIIKGMTECGRLCEIALCSEREKEFYRRANDNKVSFDRSLTLVDLFRKQAGAHPDNIAVCFKDKSLTYSQLDRYSENLAKLLARNGVGKEQPVGIMVKRCELFPICTLAVLKAGGACQPLDSNYPQDRLEFMLEDSKAQVVIADDELAGLIPNYKGTVISANNIYSLPEDSVTLLDEPDAHTLFALIYTSGSTGKPKGCMLEHANLVNFCISFCERFGVTDKDRFAAYGAFGFDASMQDLYPALTSGAAVYIVPEETRLDLVGLNEFVIGNKITMMDCTTQLGRQYITAYPQSPYMRTFTVGGEKLVPCRPPQFDFVNTYGPTECTIYVSDYKVDRQYESVPIGKSFGNCDIYILDKSGRLLPPGAVGELVISGYPVTRGYLGRDELTKEKFIDNNIFTIEGYEKMYLTGDVCRYLSNGNIQFVGRRDEQVKIRGFRIELTEIERRIREYDGITDASVIAAELPSGGKAVVAYVVSPGKVDASALGRFISEELPSYMVPSVTMQIDSIPITPNGKVDKRKLPKPAIQSSESEQSRQLNSLEKALCGMVGEITGFECSSISESLISLGLTSLTTIMLAAKLYDKYGLKVGVTELMDESCTLMTVEELIIDRLLTSDKDRSNEIQKGSLETAPLCAQQMGVYIDSMKHPDSLIFNIPISYTFAPNTDTAKLKSSLDKLIDATPVLWSKITLDGTKYIQSPIADFVSDVQVTAVEDDELAQYMTGFVKPFSLNKGPLFRAQILKTETGVVLLFDVHHIIMDGLSLSIFMRKLAEIYENGTEPETDRSYYEYIAEQTALEKSEKAGAAKQYYKALFEDYENASDITPDLNSDAEIGSLGEATYLVDRAAAESFCRENGVTPAALFLAASQYAVSRFTGDRQVYMSMISGARQDVKYFDSVGMFVKTLPVHAAIDTQRTALRFVADTAAAMTAAQRNSVYPFIKLSDKYGFASKINYACQLGVDEKITVEGKAVCEQVILPPAPKFSLSVHIEESGEGKIAVTVQYNTALYSEKLAGMISSAIGRTAENIIAEPTQKLCGISMITDEEKQRLAAFACTGKKDIPIRLFHKLFEAQAQKHPERTALIACDASYTYAQLDKVMNAAAGGLAALGVSRGDRVAILLPRTSRQIIAMYAVLKAGGAYIPCDPEYPQERIAYILENSGAKYIITDSPKGYENEINIEELIKCENTQLPDSSVTPDDTAYLIYTSGSTGRPKGVAVSHGSIANYLTPFEENIHINAMAKEGSVYVSVTTVSFDMSLKETAAALCSGLTLVLADEAQTKDPQLLCALFEKTHADVFNATPSRLEQYMLLDSFRKVLANCRIIMCGGEKYSPKLLSELKTVTKARIFNTYGPTEITVSCNAKELTDQSEICVGKPLLNVNEYIVDPDGNLLPQGAVGELYVGGAGVAKGYLNAPELTAKSFAEFGGERIYKTGDRARWTENGDIAILGRNDDQVKLRGLRIELGEVEKSILSLEGVKQAVAIIGKINSAEHLCAYYCADSSITPEIVREHISKRLAAYMIPSCLIRMDSMPQTPNGKTDVRRLPEPYLSFVSELSEPENETEKLLCDIFAQVLGMDKVSAQSSFFDLGGTSLTVTSVLVKANEKGLEISYTDIFSLKTPRALAKKAAGAQSFDDGLSDYDYSAFDDILKANVFDDGTAAKNEIGDLLLTGATGFLGIHILKRFLEISQAKVWCLVRGRDNSAEGKLKRMLYYYFENDYEELFGKRIFVINASVTSTDWFEQLDGCKIDTVINCAALVKHFSGTDDIERVNTGGVKNLIELCKKHGSMLVQVSTGSVAGDRVNGFPLNDRSLDERNFYFGQTIDNDYVKSKFLAERYVLEAIKDGLRAKIMRVGNLAPRAKDGEFQINFVSNGFMGRLRAYLVIGAYPYSMMSYPVELAPIDETADAILRLCTTGDKCIVFHPFNNHYIPLGDIILRMKQMGLGINLCDDEEFMRCVKAAQSDKQKAAMLTTLLAYENKDSSKKVEMIRTENEYTTQCLYRLGFNWSMTADDYISAFLKALKGLGFFKVEE
ncbi:MAG: amino acid adenylation domain-containing protein [Ruminococcus sp.]|nr:amino acid adenylation domain-containing protein [Ruminococcus sp.]